MCLNSPLVELQNDSDRQGTDDILQNILIENDVRKRMCYDLTSKLLLSIYTIFLHNF